MKIKLYKGPAHGKSIVVPPDRSEVLFQTAPAFHPAHLTGNHVHMQAMNIRTSRYVWSRHTHPGGSRFFVYAP